MFFKDKIKIDLIFIIGIIINIIIFLITYNILLFIILFIINFLVILYLLIKYRIKADKIKVENNDNLRKIEESLNNKI